MGRPPKKGLDYFFKDTDFYDDDKIIDLLEQEGPIGVTVYDVLLCIIYKNGYYIEFTDLDHLALKVVRTIGNRWLKKGTAKRVLLPCADIGLFDKPLLLQGVITSTGLQQRYDQVTVRSRASKDKYWLLDKKGPQSLLGIPSKIVNAEENRVFAEETPVNAEKSATKKRREENTYIYFSNPELNGVFLQYLNLRDSEQKNALTLDQKEALKKELEAAADTDEDRITICRQTFANGWHNFYPLSGKKRAAAPPKKNGFHNFSQRDYDFLEIEKKITGGGKGKVDQEIQAAGGIAPEDIYP